MAVHEKSQPVATTELHGCICIVYRRGEGDVCVFYDCFIDGWFSSPNRVSSCYGNLQRKYNRNQPTYFRLCRIKVVAVLFSHRGCKKAPTVSPPVVVT